MKVSLTIIALTAIFFNRTFAQMPEHIKKKYHLVWEDNFNGTSIDTSKWDYRATGDTRSFGIVSENNAYIDGNGHLIINVTKIDSTYHIGQIGTQNKYLTRYGYFECRAKMNKELGPHMAFWLQSPTVNKVKNDPAQTGTEIDIFEYHTNGGLNNVYHNMHWDGYGAEHKQNAAVVKVKGVNEGFHTFGLEWTSEAYVFYVDGKETWRSTRAVSQVEEYIVVSSELAGWGGDFTNSKFPDRVTFDYIRVYKKK